MSHSLLYLLHIVASSTQASFNYGIHRARPGVASSPPFFVSSTTMSTLLAGCACQRAASGSALDSSHPRRNLACLFSAGLSLLVHASYGFVNKKPLFLEIEEFSCRPCARPAFGTRLHIRGSRPPCLHTGQPVFEWPHFQANDTDFCSLPVEFDSEDLSLDPESKLTFTRTRVCFYDSEWIPKFRFRCANQSSWEVGTLKVVHEKFSKRHRLKRWLRRRNPHLSPIHFQKDRYVVEVPENADMGSSIIKITASHENDRLLYYSMLAPEDTRSSNIFSLDTVTGEIALAKPLDKETLDKHVLKITAYERLDPSISSSTTVVVDVLDVQDNSPVFERSSYYSEIREDAPIGTTVLSVFARDLDSGANGEVEYSLSDEFGADLLKINSQSGVIQTAKELDREKLASIRLNVIATDKGTPRMSSTANIEVVVLDVNDNAPVFDMDSCEATVSENITIPHQILKIIAKDGDSGVNGKAHYSIVTSSLANSFSIDYETGDLSLRSPISPKQSPVTLMIRAKDGGQPALSSTISCTVHILDVNDHAPSFLTTSMHEILVDENVAVGYELGRIFAVDEDSGPNGDVRYRLETLDETSTNVFTIDKTTGVIRTVEKLDRESKDRYLLKVIAEDGGIAPLSSSLNIVISVKDVNDNKPIFEKEAYHLTLAEDTVRGTQLLKLRATDADEDQKLVYKLEYNPRNLFTLANVGDEGAILNLAQEFSPKDHQLDVIVSATDQGGLQGFCNISIKIDDINSSPFFVETPFTIRIPENSPIGFHVVQMRADDPDREKNANLSYSIDVDDFSIDTSSGLITVTKELDRERQPSYTVNVLVRDSGDPPLSVATVLEVFLDDVNDNAPKFERSSYVISIPEDMPVGTSFMQVTAKDPDEGPNAIVDYFLNSTDQFVLMDRFRLDRTSGTLRINKPLDREKTEIYLLPIIAKDRGQPSLSSETIVTINLSDINDNSPKFEQSSYDLWIAENSPAGTVVGTVRAFDSDVGENAKIEFRIFGGPDAKLFDIETDDKETGVVHILSRQEFDYEAKTNKYFIELQASSGQLSSTVPLVIHVSDVNDNPPQLKDFMILISNFDIEKDREVGSFPSFDPDQNATLEYYLEPNDILEIAPFTGKITLKNYWNRQLDLTSKACVSDGPNTVCVQCHTIYVAVNEDVLRESMTVEIHGLSRDQFLDFPVFQRFLDAMSLLDNSWTSENIRVFSVSSTGHALNVSFFVVGYDDRPISSWKVENALFGQLRNLSDLFGYVIRLLQDDQCLHEPCPYFQKCRQALKYVNIKKTFQTDSFVMRSLDTMRTFVCECPRGFTTSDSLPGSCNQRLDLCYNNPCHNNGTCYPLENSYRCECPPNWTGPNCEFSVYVDTCLPITCHSGSVCKLEEDRRQTCLYCRWSPADTDEICRLRSLAFNGDSYLVVPKTLSRIEWIVEFKIATVSQNAILFYAGNRNRSDFIEVGLKGGLLRAEMSLGGHERIQISLPDWKENRLNDGEWHKVSVIYNNRRLRLSIDDCDSYLSINFHKAIGYAQCAVEASIDLPKRCEDPAVPCNRFFDVNSPIILGGLLVPSESTHSQVEDGFSGCMKDLYVDQQLVHFSDFQSFESKNVETGCQKNRPDKCHHENPCSRDAKCLDKWGGTMCRCHHRVHFQQSCSMESSATPVSLFSDESFVSWRLPNKITYPFRLYFEFRTRERKIQIMALEFELRSQFFLFSLESGQSMVQIGSAGQYFIPYPILADGNWHSVEVLFGTNAVNVTIDHLYEKTFSFHGSMSFSTVLSLYSGYTPSTSHPARFFGCLRNVEINANKLKILEQSKTKPGCHSANGCDPILGMCPRTSKCIRDWDRHSCKCHTGYVGDGCVDVCSIEKICGPKGVCIRSNNTRGYDCLCPENLGGENCDKKALTKACPYGWFGSFPNCKKCECKTSKGFRQQCDRLTGRCICESDFYELNGKCVPCECGYGSVSTSCSETGQCQCSGEATGRRCDRCKDNSRLLDRKTLQCQKVPNKCPSNIDYGVQWPTTNAGAVARHSCPTQMGIAIRKCSHNGQWMDVDSSNCSLPLLYDLQLKIATDFESMDILRILFNITKSFHYTSTKNIDDVSSILSAIVPKEHLLNNASKSLNLRDLEFTEMVLAVVDHLLDQPLYEEQFLNVVSIVYDFGEELTKLYKSSKYLKPFQSVNEHIMFVVDRFDKNSREKVAKLPKYDHFGRANQENRRENRISLTPSAGDTVFFSFIDEPQCRECYHSFVLTHRESTTYETSSIQVSIRLNEEAGWKYPECAMLSINGLKKAQVAPKWSHGNGFLVGINRTHATCQFEANSGIFTVLARSDHGSLVRFSLPSGQMPYATPMCALVSLLICAISLVMTFFRNGHQTRLIRCALIIAFVLDATAFLFVAKITIKPVFCPVRNAVLTFVTSSLFSWLFAYSLQIYKILVDGHPGSCHTLSLILGLVTPSVLSTASFLISQSCNLKLLSWSFWLLIGPVGLFLLLSFYALSTSFLLSTDKQYELLVAKFSLKNLLLSHSILVILCLLYNTLGLYAFVSGQNTFNIELSTNIMLLLTSIYIVIWTNYFSYQKTNNRKTDVLWVNEDVPKSMLDEPECSDPLLSSGQKVYGGLPNEWMPDVIPTETYIHHTLQRTLQRMPQILSPPAKVFDPIPPQYSNTICISDMSNVVESPISNRITRTGSSAGAYGSSKFASTVDDQMDDAYYTYTARRKKPPASTFGN